MEAGNQDVAARVEEARKGDRAAQEWVAQRVYEVGLRLAAFSLGDSNLAQDVGQEAAMRAIRSLRKLRDPARFDAWAYRICVGELKRIAKRRGRDEWQSYEDVLADVGVESRHPELIAERDWLVPALAKLSERQRIVVALRYVHDLTDREIADAIRARPGTVRSLLSRALAHLRERAEEIESEAFREEQLSEMRGSLISGMEVTQ